MRIIAALDIVDGKCVRLTRGDFNTRKVYNEDPLEVARQMEDNGIKYLHLVDLDGAKNRKITNLRILEKITKSTSLKIDFGGGVRSDNDLKIIFDSGAVQVTAGSIAVTDPDLFVKWLAEYGQDKIILGADFKNGKLLTCGWTENSDKDLISFLSDYQKKGVKYTICTDIERDGMLGGPATELYKVIVDKMVINLIASGGISTIDDIDSLRGAGCEGVIIGKAIYEGRISLKELGQLC